MRLFKDTCNSLSTHECTQEINNNYINYLTYKMKIQLSSILHNIDD